jgi:hypothetical protein
MTKILSGLNVEYLDNSNIAFLHAPFGFISDALIKNGLRQVGWELREKGHEDEVWIPIGFVFDFESTPNLIRGVVGENKRGGASHDVACRKEAFVCFNGTKSKMTKGIAADVYFEIMEYCNSVDTARFAEDKHKLLPNFAIIPYVKTRDWTRRWVKSTLVRFWPGDYFQKYLITATSEEIYGIKADLYMTIEEKIELMKEAGIETDVITEVKKGEVI